ncbi:hypothetical protein B0H14DRAFT_3471354 [Mycena olivaceomarginata]|nr:hypothetical protein B0H14DRAFT_3471354 [Mycena olivaceomarginata]
MLSLPTPGDADTMDGCPFVLPPDTAEDTGNFLRAVLCFGFFDHFPTSTSFPIL